MMTTMWLVALKGMGILVGAVFASLLLGRASASLRHLIWTASLAAVLALPLLEATGVRLEIPMPAAWLARSTTDVVIPAQPESWVTESVRGEDVSTRAVEWGVTPTKPVAGEDEEATTSTVATPSVPAKSTAVPRAPRMATSLPAPANQRTEAVAQTRSVRWLTLLTYVWTLGSLLLLSATLFSHLAAHQLTTHGVRSAPPAARRRLAVLTVGLGIRRPVRLVVSSAVRVPATWGLRRATIVLPEHFESWSWDTLDRVLLHELAHVRRHDCWARVLGDVARALYWPNPLVWLAARRQRQESERACDDQVLAHGDVPSEYADDLVGLVRALRVGSALPSAALGMAGASGLGQRVQAILDPKRSRSRVGRAGSAAVGAIALGLAFSAAALVPVVAAQDRTDEPSPAPPAVVPAEVSLYTLPALVDARWNPPAPTLTAPSTSPSMVLSNAGPGAAQSQELCVFRDEGPRSTSYHTDDNVSRIRWETDFCRVEIDLEGDVVFAADDSGVVRMSDGALFEVEERIGRDSRRARFEGERGGRIERRYWVDGDAVPWGPEADRWIAQVLPEMFRHTTINASARVRRMLDAGGPDRVFAEVARMRSDHVAKTYLEILIREADLTETEYIRVIDFAARIESDHNAGELLLAVVDEAGLRPEFQTPMLRAAEGLESDHTKALVLQALLESPLSAAQLNAVLRSAQTIDSDHSLGQILSTIAREGRLSDAGRAAFMETLESIESDHQHAMVLNAFLDAGPLSSDELSHVLEMTRGLDSDHQRGSVLQRVASEYSLSGNQVSAYLRAASEIDSDHQVALTAEAIIERAVLTSDQLTLVLTLADGVDSDHQRAMILQQVIERRDLTSDEVGLVLDVATDLDSDHQLSSTLILLATDEALDEGGVLALIEAAGEIESDHNRAAVLMSIADRYEVEGAARTRYLEVAEDMGRHQRNQVLAAIVR